MDFIFFFLFLVCTAVLLILQRWRISAVLRVPEALIMASYMWLMPSHSTRSWPYDGKDVWSLLI